MARKGLAAGLVVGLLALSAVFTVAWQCLPWRISSPPPPWPWACADPAFGVVAFLAFPVNLLTDDLSRAVALSPLALLMYVAMGGLVGLGLGRSRRFRG
jgi:hypothetical protein